MMNEKEKKSVLIINQHFSTGGIKKSLENMLLVLMNRYNVKVVFVSGNSREFDEKFPGIRITSPFLLSSILSSIKELRTMNWRLVRIFLRIGYVVLSRLFGQERLVNCAVDLARQLGRYDCVISYAHDNWTIDGGFYGGGNRLAIKKTKSTNKISWIHGELETFGLNKNRLLYTYSQFDKVVGVSNAVKEQFEMMSENKIKCDLVYNIINLSEIKNKCENTSYEGETTYFRIVTVGRLSKVAKRVDKINEIAKILKAKGYVFRWTVVGGGSEYDSCVSVCKQYGLENYVEYIGNQDNPYPFMKRSDLFVLVSDTESFSLVINESLVVGTPVITTDFPAAQESISDGVNGFIVKKDINSICDKIAFCMDNKEVLHRMRNAILDLPYSNNSSIEKMVSLIG